MWCARLAAALEALVHRRERGEVLGLVVVCTALVMADAVVRFLHRIGGRGPGSTGLDHLHRPLLPLGRLGAQELGASSHPVQQGEQRHDGADEVEE